MTKDLGNIKETLASLSSKAANLMKVTKDQEEFAKKKQECFLECLAVVEALTWIFENPDGSSVHKLSEKSKEILEKYKGYL